MIKKLLLVLLLSLGLISTASATTPTITDIKFAPSMHDGLYKSGDKVRIIVSFSESVKVDLGKFRKWNNQLNCKERNNLDLLNLCKWSLTDAPFLILETGKIDRIAKYIQGSGTKNLFFEYIVQDNDSSFIPNIQAASINNPSSKEYLVQRLGLLRGARTVDWGRFVHARDVAVISQDNMITSISSSEEAELTYHIDNDTWLDPLRTFNRILIDGKSPIHWKHHNIIGDWVNNEKTLVQTAGAEQVFLIDLDKDDDIDILSASSINKYQTPPSCGIVWHKNMGDKSFISRYIYESDGLRTVQASDMDNDGDIDIIAGGTNKIIWFENIDNQDFIYHEILSEEDLVVSQVFPADIDADGDQDVLAAIQWTNTFSWYENVNNADHFIEHVISDNALGAHDILAIDIDLDHDLDLVTASFEDHTVAWYENNNSQQFTKHQITNSALATSSVKVIDLDQDGDIDILADSAENDSITWYENDDKESFIAHDITKTADRAYDVFPIDLDSDGDIDVLSASSYDHKIAWYENDGNQNFVSHIITTQAVRASSVSAADLDNDGDIDVVSSSMGDSSVNWYENTSITVD